MSAAAGARGPVPCGASPRAFGLWLAAALGVGAGAPLGLPFLESAPVPPALPHSLGPGFALAAPDGTPVSDHSLHGTPYVVVFGYTRCGAPCRERLDRVLHWRAQLAEDGGDAAGALPVLFITVDPEHDTPARMADFAARAPGPVLALTGSPQAVARAAQAFNAVYFKAALCSGGTIINHSGAAYLVGPDARPQAIIAAGESDAGALAKLRALLAA